MNSRKNERKNPSLKQKYAENKAHGKLVHECVTKYTIIHDFTFTEFVESFVFMQSVRIGKEMWLSNFLLTSK